MGKQCVLCQEGIGFTGPAGLKDGQPVCGKCFKQFDAELKEQEEANKEAKSQRNAELFARTAQYKPQWDKNGIIQFKNERIAILKRQVGVQVEFIIAFDDLTKEGYDLKAIDEGKSMDTGMGLGSGASSYYYFQKR